MNREQFAEVSEVFLAARAVDGERRAEVLAERCGGNGALREEVERLLAADGRRSDGLDDSAMVDGINLEAFQGLVSESGTPHGLGASPEMELPQTIGRFRIIRKLGEGGMGVVCEAEQDNPRRMVALKLLRTGYLSTGLSRRFAHEAQVLARLQHPGIARIYEAGTAATPSGVQPYFAMELINGRPLMEHVGAAPLSVSERLGLFLLVCEAVEYAHRKGVIHRDLKPANILVDEHGNPRILDFGVARVTDSDLQVSTMQTNPGQLVGTLPYMSPEQVSGSSDVVDTRTDVYALGIILFQLLSGRLPYDTRSKSIAEAARIIRDQEPTRLGSVDTTLRGDLDVIVSRALEKEVGRRYASVGALAGDIQRFLRHEPIEARPASQVYLVKKFARRHPELIAGLGMAVLALSVGVVASTWGLLTAVEERDQAKKSEERALLREREADAAAMRAQRLTDAMSKLMAAARPGEVSTATDGTIAKLQKAASDIASELSDDPVAELRFQEEMGETMMSMADFAAAVGHANRAYQIACRLYGPTSVETLEWEARVVKAYAHEVLTGLRDREFNQAVQRDYRMALERAREALGDRHDLTVRLLAGVAELEHYILDWAGSLQACEELLRVLPSLPEDQRPCSLTKVYCAAANSSAWLGRMDDYQKFCDLAMEANAVEPAELTLDSTWPVAWIIHKRQGKEAAHEYLRRQLELAETRYGPSHTRASSLRGFLQAFLVASGSAREALNLALKERVIASHRWPRDHKGHLWTLSHIAQMQAWCGQLDDAASTYEQVLGLFRRIGHLAPPGMSEDVWRKAELALHFQAFGPWVSKSLRNDLRYEINRLLARRSFPDLPLYSVDWKGFEGRLTPVAGGPSLELRVPGVFSTPEPAPGLYRLDLRIKVGDQELTGTTWLHYAPWHIRRYDDNFLNLGSYEQWQRRIADPIDDEVQCRSIMSEIWWEGGFGPYGLEYTFGLIAETTVAYPAGLYTVELDADDGGRVLLDGTPIIEAWPDRQQGRNTTATVMLTGREQHWRIEYAQLEGWGRLRLVIAPAAEGSAD